MQKQTEKEVSIRLEGLTLKGDLFLPSDMAALVIFSHGSGSSRLSPRNRSVAQYLNKFGFGTFLFDLLTEEEDRTYENRFNIPLLSKRLSETTLWLEKEGYAQHCRLGYFGASTGAASALLAAAARPEVAAVVCRGGRPDLAMSSLHYVKAPTLLIVGGKDTHVLQLNEAAYMQLTCPKKLAIVPGATHLFEEPGALQEVCSLASQWFESHLKPAVTYDD